MSLTGRGRGVLLAGAAGIVAAYATGVDVILVVSTLLVAAVVASALAARHRRPTLAVHRSFGVDRAMRDHPVPVQIDVANRSLRAVGAATFTDEWVWQSPPGVRSRPITGASARARLPRLQGRRGDVHGSVTVGWEFIPPRRGAFDIGPLRVTVFDPFGLAAAVAVAGDTTRLTVLPVIVVLDDIIELRRQAEGRAHRADHRVSGGEHDLTTRVYRPGDPVRRVHWRASARHGELMVRQEEHRSAAEVSILLETRRSHHFDADASDSHASASFEWAVSMAASLATHLDSAGFLVHLLETGEPQLAPEPGIPLTGLATVGLTKEERPTGISLVPPGRDGASRLGSVFAVLAHLDDDIVSRLLRARSSYGEAIAFVPAMMHQLETERLEAAGWHCVPVSPRTSVADAWRAAQSHGGTSEED